MKKIYAKLTKERAERFQIETAIYELENGRKFVEKRPLTKMAQEHVYKMFEHYSFFMGQGNNSFLSCEMIGDRVRFPFVRGQSFYDKIIRAAQSGNRDAVLAVWKQYQELLQELYPSCKPLEKSEAFDAIFGEQEALLGMSAASYVDLDLTLDNIICEGEHIRILDYEWMFDFRLPVKFPAYRAIYALYVKDGSLMNKIVDSSEIYEMFSISDSEKKLFEEMNKNFMDYVEGHDRSYQKLLVPYRKPELCLGVEMESDEFGQVYWGIEGLYSELRMCNYEVKTEGLNRIEIDLCAFDHVDMIRIDPCNWPGMIRVHRFEVETEDKVRKLNTDEYDSNVMAVSGKMWIFQSADPQIIIPVRNAGWTKIVLVYELLMSHLETQEEYASVLQDVYQLQIEKWQRKYEKQSQLLSKCAHRIQLLENKLNCIENTKAFKLLLRKKVANIRIWDELNQ